MRSKSNINKKISSPHYPVLLKEVLENMNIKDNGVYLDCTFGAGGYSKAILNKAKCRLVALDQDKSVLPFVNDVKEIFPDAFSFHNINFAEAKKYLPDYKFDGIVLDLGVSSMQLDNGGRGFSFMKDGPLDMRMGNTMQTAADFINEASEKEIADVIYKYGQEVQSRQIAKAIVNARLESKIETTLHFAEIVRNSMHYRKSKIDPVTKTFQAIRIHINRELDVIEKFLDNVEDMLLPGGRVLVVSFHSLEDSIVKLFLKEHSAKKVARSKYSKDPEIIEEGKWIKVVNKKPITPSKEEVLENPRSRSSRLRVAEKIRGSDYVS